MRTIQKTILAFLSVLLWGVFSTPAPAQQNPVQCLCNIQKRLEDLGNPAEFDYQQLREIMRQFDYGELSTATADPAKAAAFKRTLTSLSEFCDLAGTNLSAKGMKGYSRCSGALIDPLDDAVSAINVSDLKKAFTKGSGFQGSDFDGFVSKFEDPKRFKYDQKNQIITSSSGYKMGPEDYLVNGDKGGEKTALTHILRGHIDNSSVVSNTSKFYKAAEIPDLLDEAWEKIKRWKIDPASEPDVQLFKGQPNAFVVTFKDQAGSPKMIGKNIGGTSDTNKMRLFANGQNGPEFIRTAFPD